MEAEIIPMCKDQGMAIVSWAALGGGQLMSAEQRKRTEQNPDARPKGSRRDADRNVSDVLEKIAVDNSTTLQAVGFPIVGVQTIEHVKAMPEAMRVSLSKSDIEGTQSAYKFDPLFPMSFLFNHRNDQPYSLALTAADNQQCQMAAWINSPPK
ncbi:uncharacterized protein A1O9_00664 [Exophiala aquamarina CBS 119918]|uniref:NADP-dependent oxidoreductase domain-containing protein n=1 Tax=Exophiala aquamarina CBS 119918 TaxID=1182545 RepID=A0A072PS53_9EURO|nr:uncharacterized protein A1O9_00664 [Exophiala aquamarina CBS 119918]KEF62691.1 hypothetical protein A1O9_00664 [Exophiala aquamarina CBS 119918]